MANSDMPLEDLLKHLEVLANDALLLWDLPSGAVAKLINVSENATYIVESSRGYKAILRVHRENYHTRRAIECELAWLDALSTESLVKTPGYFVGKNGEAIQEMKADGLSEPRFLVLFEFVEGSAPSESGDITSGFHELGTLAAHCHLHAIKWDKPEPFERLTWDIDTVFGNNPTWGNWRDAPEVDGAVIEVLNQVESMIRLRLSNYGKSPDRFNLIHADMRLANLIVSNSGTRLIDFDDCGHGWLMYDFAAAISFIEDDPRIPACKEAWLEGYKSVRSLSQQDIDEIDTFVMLRRMALLAWIGSHIEAPEPQELSPGFASKTSELGQIWLESLR